MNVPWRIEMLGGLRLSPHGQPERTITRFARSKAASLLAYLASYPRTLHPREELANRFWPDASAEAGRTSLRTALASLRRQLEPPDGTIGTLFIADRNYVRLNPNAFTTDIADFEAALKRGDRAEAIRLYKGEFLPGFYDDWAIDERTRFAALYEAIEEPLPARESLPENDAPQPRITVSAPDAIPPQALLGLPPVFTRYFGREKEIADATRSLTQQGPRRERLLTLTGPGGAGKTRLALEIGQAVAPAFGNAVFFVSLADLSDGLPMAGWILRSLPQPAGTSAAEDRSALETVIRRLAAYPTALLILDNLEHLIESGAAALTLSLLTRLPNLTIIATSRRRLSVAGERETLVLPLPIPSETDWLCPERLAEYPAIRLFVDRAQAVRPDFQLTGNNAAAVAALCSRLEGLPLAIELVAARAHSLTPTQMLKGLEERWTLLFSTRRDKTERHRSLHAAIAWSMHLLPPALRVFWTRLSVFRGGCTPETATAVTGEPYALEFLTQLRERSLLIAEEAAGGMRFRLLEALRDFAASQIAPEERETLAGRHFDIFLQEAETALPQLQGQDAAHFLDVLESERDNLNAALNWCRESGAAERGLRLAAALWRFWELRGYLSEGRAWLDDLLAREWAGEPTLDRVKALNGAGMLAARQGDYTAARKRHEENLALSRKIGHAPSIAVALGNLGLVAAEQGRYDDGRALYEESLALRREIKDTFGIGLMLNNLGTLSYELGDYVAARRYLEEAVAARRQSGDRGGVAASLGNLGNVAFFQGDYTTARRLHEEGLSVLREIGDKRGVAYALLNLGEMAASQGEDARRYHAECLPLLQKLGDLWALSYAFDSVAGQAAARDQYETAAYLRGAAASLREATGSCVPPNHRAEHERATCQLRAALGDSAFDHAFQRGKLAPPKESIALAIDSVLTEPA